MHFLVLTDIETTLGAALQFDFQYIVKRPGDIIITAGDERLSFFVSPTRLAAVSSFFDNLPPPSTPCDTLEGVPVLPLHGTTSDGLYILLRAIKSMSDAAPFRPPSCDPHAILEAVVAAKLYDVAVAFRLLSDAVAFDDDWSLFTTWAIWAIADVESEAVVFSFHTVNISLMRLPLYLIDVVKQHAPRHWERLQNLHIRQLLAACEIRQHTKSPIHPSLRFSHDESRGVCEEGRWTNKKHPVERVAEHLSTIEGVSGARDFTDDGFGLRCGSCIEAANMVYGPKITEWEGITGWY